MSFPPPSPNPTPLPNPPLALVGLTASPNSPLAESGLMYICCWCCCWALANTYPGEGRPFVRLSLPESGVLV